MSWKIQTTSRTRVKRLLYPHLVFGVEAACHMSRFLKEGVEQERLPDGHLATEPAVPLDIGQPLCQPAREDCSAVHRELAADPQLAPTTAVAQHVQQRRTFALWNRGERSAGEHQISHSRAARFSHSCIGKRRLREENKPVR